ncbi:RNA-guided pseudouridylation complex pseudouridine synthase subunit Cbf5 [Candidatus Woesearchaeota archaeon]|nr:RNA-guided pseudouridylation complex pseudouridine synthase subunit Cbf5 [Candidatus Woesearchaeota archaeon]
MTIAFFGTMFEKWLPSYKEQWFFKREFDLKPRLDGKGFIKLESLNYKTEELFNYGVVCVDKPSGPSSHQVSDYVKKILNVKKAGHGGTLDPKVTGLLPVALNRSTLALRALLNAPKEYVCLFRLHRDVSQDELLENIKQRVGLITQLPPKKSAVKRHFRKRFVYYVEVLDIVGREVLIKIATQAGTYIRKWVHDLGLKIGGAHMTELRRTRVAMLSEHDLVTLQDLSDAFYFYNQGLDSWLLKTVKPLELLIQHLPKIVVTPAAENTIKHGASLKVPGVIAFTSFKNQDLVALLNPELKLIALGRALIESNDLSLKSHGVVAKLERVIRL